MLRTSTQRARSVRERGHGVFCVLSLPLPSSSARCISAGKEGWAGGMLLGTSDGGRRRGGAGFLLAEPEPGQPRRPARLRTTASFPRWLLRASSRDTFKAALADLALRWVVEQPGSSPRRGMLPDPLESKPHGRALPYQCVMIFGKVNLHSWLSHPDIEDILSRLSRLPSLLFQGIRWIPPSVPCKTQPKSYDGLNSFLSGLQLFSTVSCVCEAVAKMTGRISLWTSTQ